MPADRRASRAVTTELVPYAQAPWAPRLAGAKWAYRITTVTGNTLIATSAYPRTRVEADIRRLTRQLEGGIPGSLRRQMRRECAKAASG
jgi:hypothetical protein